MIKNESLTTSIAGIPLVNPLMNASGCWCTSAVELNDIRDSNSSVVVSKSGTLLARVGNPEPRLYWDNKGSINAMGLPNFGYDYYTEYGTTLNKPFIQSIHPFNPEQLEQMLETISATGFSDTKTPIIELNISCPNLIGASSGINWIYYSDMMSCMHKFSEKIIWGLKTPPLYESKDFEQMGSFVNMFGAKFVTCVNSIPNGMILDPATLKPRIYPKGGLGGIGGSYIKPIALSNVYQYYKEFKHMNYNIDIIGCGGVESAQDVLDYLACGANAVQIGTHLLREGPNCFLALEGDLYNELYEREKTVKELIGTAHTVDF